MKSNLDSLDSYAEDTESLDLMLVDNTNSDPKQLELERASEVILQLLISAIERALFTFPTIPKDPFNDTVSEINKFLSYHHIYEDAEMLDILCRNLTKNLESYGWIQEISKWLKSRWGEIVKEISNEKPSTYYPAIDELTKTGFLGLRTLFSYLLDLLQQTPLKYCKYSPKLSDWEAFFMQKAQELKQRTKKLKVQLKLNPGVEPPQIKRVTREFYRTVRRPYTEWNTFYHEEEFEIDIQPSCVMIPVVHRLCNAFTETKREIVTFYAPTGWEVTRVGANVLEGNFKTATVRRVGFRENKGMAEIEVVFPRITKLRIFCKVAIEGVMSRKRIQDVQVAEPKTVLVIVDDYGEHELPQGFLEDDLD